MNDARRGKSLTLHAPRGDHAQRLWHGMRYEQLSLSGFNDRTEVRASNPLGRIPALMDTDKAIPRLRALTKNLANEPAFRSTEP